MTFWWNHEISCIWNAHFLGLDILPLSARETVAPKARVAGAHRLTWGTFGFWCGEATNLQSSNKLHGNTTDLHVRNREVHLHPETVQTV